MSNRINNWEQLLEIANKDLKDKGAELIVTFVDETGDYDLNIKYKDSITDHYAQSYYEDELGDLINDAWAHARKKCEQLEEFKTVSRQRKEKREIPTYDDLKRKLDDTLMRSLITMAHDQTLGKTKLDQMRWMVFNYITNQYWDNANDNEPLKIK